jgi:hypothetical protein
VHFLDLLVGVIELLGEMRHLRLQLGDALSQEFVVGHDYLVIIWLQHHQQRGRRDVAGGASLGSSSSSTGSRGAAGAAGTGGGSGVGIAAGAEGWALALGAAMRLKRPIRPGRLFFVGVNCLDLGGFPSSGSRGLCRCQPHADTPASVLESIQL